MNKSKMFSINGADFAKGIVMAVLAGLVLPVAAAIQTPGFDILHANWSGITTLALNGAFVGFVSYLIKAFFSDNEGKTLGVIG